VESHAGPSSLTHASLPRASTYEREKDTGSVRPRQQWSEIVPSNTFVKSNNSQAVMVL